MRLSILHDKKRLAILLTVALLMIAGIAAFALGSDVLETRRGRLLFSRIFLICAGLYGLLVFAVWRDFFRSLLKAFFSAKAPPINLAVFRIVLFWMLFRTASDRFPTIVWYSQVPPEFHIAPVGLEWLLGYLPINKKWAIVSCAALLVFSFTAMIGFFTRTSAWVTAIAGTYALGIPELFGKVDHYHHLVWFPAILAASRCGDAFSIDAALAARRRADHGVTEPPGASIVYAVPLRFLWLLFGIIYFFPGFAKLWVSGLDWALSDNLKFVMYRTWDYPDGWMPFFRVDRYPFLYKLGGLATIAFEMSFLFLIWFPRLRLVAVSGGIFFHTMTELFLRIKFRSLLACYVVFFDWDKILRRIGHWLYREELNVIYDGNCKTCRRTIAILRVFDVFRRLVYVDANDREAIKDHGLTWLDSSVVSANLCVAGHGKNWSGFSAYRVLADRIPVFWPVLPVLYVWPIPAMAARLYRHLADSRACNIVPPGQSKDFRMASGSIRPVVTVGVVLLGGNILCGMGGATKAWPFAVYPTFAVMSNEVTLEKNKTVTTVAMIVTKYSGEVISLDALAPSRPFPRHYLLMVRRILNTDNSEDRDILLKALWRLWIQSDPRLRYANSVSFHKVTTLVDRANKNPLDREFLLELNHVNETGRSEVTADRPMP